MILWYTTVKFRGPTIFIYDCPKAGLALEKLEEFKLKLFSEYELRRLTDPKLQPLDDEVTDLIQLAACGSDEHLPIAANLPHDLFTSCLTTPVNLIQL